MFACLNQEHGVSLMRRRRWEPVTKYLLPSVAAVMLLLTGCKSLDEAAACYCDLDCNSLYRCVNGTCLARDGGCLEGTTTTCAELYHSFYDCADRELVCTEDGKWPSKTRCGPNPGECCEDMDCDAWGTDKTRRYISNADECFETCREAGWPAAAFESDTECECQILETDQPICDPVEPWHVDRDLTACPPGMSCRRLTRDPETDAIIYYCTTRGWNYPCFVGDRATGGQCRAYCDFEHPENQKCKCEELKEELGQGGCVCDCGCEPGTIDECRLDGTCECLALEHDIGF